MPENRKTTLWPPSILNPRSPSLSVVVPCYNEESVQIVLVDDGSSDSITGFSVVPLPIASGQAILLLTLSAFTALAFVLVYLGAVMLLGEKISVPTVAGIVAILFGLYLISQYNS
jgi:hypothetical protein